MAARVSRAAFCLRPFVCVTGDFRAVLGICARPADAAEIATRYRELLMRGLFIGAAFAVAFTVGTAVVAPANPTQQQAAADSVQPGFAGMKQIGAWRLACLKSAGNPGAAPTNPVKTSVIQKDGHKMLNVRVVIPPRPCKVIDVLKEGDRLEHQIAAWFILRGPYGVLSLLFHAPVALFPGETVSPTSPRSKMASTGGAKPAPDSNSGPEFVTLDCDGAALKGPVIVCGPFACIAGIKIRHEDEPKFLASRHLALELPAFPGKQPVRIDLPASGLPEAIGAMRRVEK
jgi:invasion protein IalB